MTYFVITGLKVETEWTGGSGGGGRGGRGSMGGPWGTPLMSLMYLDVCILKCASSRPRLLGSRRGS